MNPDISIIVPVYNVEKYLNRCIESILAQTLTNIEIVLVDDGSTDTSGQMCDEWVEKDSRISVIHKNNGGLTDAWKTGVLESRGNYLGFVDSDDYVDETMYETLYQKAESTNADITVCGLVFTFEDSKQKQRKEISGFHREVYNREMIIKELYPTLLNDGSFFGRTIQAARVTKLFRRNIVLDNLKYCSESVSVGEDLQLTFSTLCDATTVALIPDYFPYHYWINTSSITGKHDPTYINKIIKLREQIMLINEEKNVYDFRNQINNDFVSLVVLGTKNEICRNSTDSRKQIIDTLKSICIKKEVKEALKGYDMPHLSITEKLYLNFLKYKLYFLCYYAVKIFLS